MGDFRHTLCCIENVIGTDVEQFLKVFFGLEVIRRESDEKKMQRDKLLNAYK